MSDPAMLMCLYEFMVIPHVPVRLTAQVCSCVYILNISFIFISSVLSFTKPPNSSNIHTHGFSLLDRFVHVLLQGQVQQ